MTDHGCTIDGQPALPILVSEHTQLVTRLAEAEAQLAALRQVARGYCPHCGRGDAAPGVDDWEQQRQRGDRAEAALARVRALADRWDNALAPDRAYARTLRNALDTPEPNPVTDLHDRITAAIRNTPARYPDDIATAVMAALKPELDRLHRAEAELQQIDEADSAAAAAGSYAERAERVEAVLAEVLGQFQPLRPEHNPTGEPGHWQARVLPHEIDAWQKAATTGPDDAHVYLSTGCLHGDHDYCKNMTGLNGAKRPASCKKCGAKCICSCHRDQPTADPAATQVTSEPKSRCDCPPTQAGLELCPACPGRTKEQP